MIDLHVHSWYSEDGEASPEWLVQECAEKGISALAITDHNCVKAHVAAAREAEKIIFCTYQVLKLIAAIQESTFRCWAMELIFGAMIFRSSTMI